MADCDIGASAIGSLNFVAKGKKKKKKKNVKKNGKVKKKKRPRSSPQVGIEVCF
jgi:hypothetical protein